MSRFEKFGYGILIISTLIGVSAAVSAGLELYQFNRRINPNPVYRDVNGDGVEDKILGEKILYGVNIDGTRLYLPKEQFEKLK